MKNWNLHPKFLMSLLSTAGISTGDEGKLVLRCCYCKNLIEPEPLCICHPYQVSYIEVSDSTIGLIMQVELGLNQKRTNDLELLRVHQKLLRLRERCQLAVSEIDRELKAIDENPSAYTVFYGNYVLKRCKRNLREK